MGLELNKFNSIFSNKVEENEEIINNFFIEGEEWIIDIFSIENAGVLDLTSEVELWTKIGNIKLRFKRDFDIVLINKLLSKAVLNK